MSLIRSTTSFLQHRMVRSENHSSGLGWVSAGYITLISESSELPGMIIVGGSFTNGFPCCGKFFPPPISRSHFAKLSLCGVRSSLIFCLRYNTSVPGHNFDLRREALMICCRDPRCTTGRVCLKSPPNRTVIPPKGRLLRLMSWSVRSMASISCLCCIGASSQMIMLAARKRPSIFFSLSFEHVEFSCAEIGILKQECAVRPPSRRREAIPEDATQGRPSSVLARQQQWYYRHRFSHHLLRCGGRTSSLCY